MKYFLFSDVHGEYDALITSLEAAGFDISNPDHYLVGLGDYFDRGHQNHQVLDFILSMLDQGRIKLIRGNHDDMLLNFIRGKESMNNILMNGLDKTILNLAGQTISDTFNEFFVLNMQNDLRREILKRYPQLEKVLLEMVDILYLSNYILVHAGFDIKENEHGKVVSVKPNNWTHTERMIAHYEDFLYSDKYKYVFGHWHASQLNKKFKMKTGNPNKFVYKNFIGIDAMTNITEEVTILVVETNESIK
jgi:predicted phosphodiesterase